MGKIQIQPKQSVLDKTINKTFTRLKVIKFQYYKQWTSKREPVWNCSCECGLQNILVTDSNLKQGNTKSCGCFQKDGLKKLHLKNIKENAPFDAVLREYVSSAKRRNLEFGLSKEQFLFLTSQNCFYCNSIPSTIKDRNGKDEYKGKLFIYNGIDRIDNALGYTIENSVSCCRMCNWMKGSLDQVAFLQQVQKISSHILKRHSCNAGGTNS